MSWRKGRLLGQGGSSTVYECFLTETSTRAAVKEIHKNGLSLAQMNVIQAEIDLLKTLSHPNVIQYIGTEYTTTHFYIFLEYAEGGSLRQLYLKYGAFDDGIVKYFLQQVLNGLSYLRVKGIAHRDVKGANILITEDGIAKLADFGSSKKLIMESLVSGIKGTPHFMAPEVIKGTQAVTGWYKADIWSVGCLVIELSSGALPFAKYENSMTVMFKIASGETPPMECLNSSPLRAFVEICCSGDPSLRPSAEELLMDPLFTSNDSNVFSRVLSMISSDDESFGHSRAEDMREVDDDLYADDDEVTVCATIIPSLRIPPNTISSESVMEAASEESDDDVKKEPRIRRDNETLIEFNAATNASSANNKPLDSTSSSSSGLSEERASPDELNKMDGRLQPGPNIQTVSNDCILFLVNLLLAGATQSSDQWGNSALWCFSCR